MQANRQYTSEQAGRNAGKSRQPVRQGRTGRQQGNHFRAGRQAGKIRNRFSPAGDIMLAAKTRQAGQRR
jgi:hypothetical protein